MNPSNKKRMIALILIFMSAACTHGVDIEGEGHVLSSSGLRDCYKADAPCTFEVVDAYQESYTAIPAPGYEFVGWQFCGEETSATCSYNIPKSVVQRYYGETMPNIVAQFQKVVTSFSPVLSYTIADDRAFVVDDESVELVIKSASYEGAELSAASFSWVSSIDGSLATNVAIGEVTTATLTAGQHNLSLVIEDEINGVGSEVISLRVLPRRLDIPADQETPAANAKALMPVVAITHIPTVDGVNLDLSVVTDPYRPPEWSGAKISDVIDYLQTLASRKKYALEERSRFRGYKNPSAEPYLGYKVLAHYVYYTPAPLLDRLNPFNASRRMFDSAGVLNRVDAEHWVENENVKEFWLFNYSFIEGEEGAFEVWESNMSSPTTPDVSNSDRFSGDLPIFSKTYMVYGANYHRTQAEAIHNFGHQQEAMMDYIDRKFSGTSDLFWGAYVGVIGFPGPPVTPGRCGWTHSPPNTDGNYDYYNQTLVDVDCEDWRPDGTGNKVAVNAPYFGTLNYDWPKVNNVLPQKDESNFYLWWMQNMPGDQNGIPYNNTTMENWWKFIADWDAANTSGLKLYK